MLQQVEVHVGTTSVGDFIAELKSWPRRLPVLISGQHLDGIYGFFAKSELSIKEVAQLDSGFWSAPGQTGARALVLRNVVADHPSPPLLDELIDLLEDHDSDLPMLVSTVADGAAVLSSRLTIDCRWVKHAELSRWDIRPTGTIAVLVSAERG